MVFLSQFSEETCDATDVDVAGTFFATRFLIAV